MSELELETIARCFQFNGTQAGKINSTGLHDRYKQKETTYSWESTEYCVEQNASLCVQNKSKETHGAAVAVYQSKSENRGCLENRELWEQILVH